jgi:elongator complex protein 5
MSLFTYLATTIITLHSVSHVLARKSAKDRSLMTPVFGLEEEKNGVIVGRVDGPALKGNEGIVLELEHRRKSGRSVSEWYFLPAAHKYHPQQAREVVTLLDDHPLYRPPEEPRDRQANESEEPESTFELGLTERQRRDRENVVLPYFDAQKGEGPGEGGRILYDMGEEDDFDEEEDEI